MSDESVYLFIGGYLGEILRKSFVFSYFRDMEEFIYKNSKEFTTEFIQNPYNKDIEAGAQLINKKVHEICVLNNKKVVLVGHSRGSLEILHFLNNYPSLASNKNIQKIIFSSPLFGKSDIADILSRYLKPFLPKNIIRPLKEVATNKVQREVLEIWDKINHLHSKKCLIIKTSTNNKNHFPFFLKVSHKIINKKSGENDGVLALSSQTSLKNVKEARFYSNHGAIFCNSKINRFDQVDISDIFKMLHNSEYEKENSFKSNFFDNVLYLHPAKESHV